MRISAALTLQITYFFGLLLTGKLDHPANLAAELDKMAKMAWLEVDSLEQSAIRIP